jgi:beta-glucosidase
MTLEEKAAQLGSFWIYEILDGTVFSPAKAARLMAHGIGHVTRLGGGSNVRPREAAALANTIQKHLQDNTRLKIPAIVHEECCSGYMAFGATVFPQAIGVASTWQPELVEAMTAVIRQQMRAVGAHHALAPVIDVARDARWGRTEETFGEDPYLVARMGVSYIDGLQGESMANGVIATAKHFVGYGASEGGMNWAPPHLSPRELREVYLFPFEAAVRVAGLASLMNGYHELDGVPCGASRELLTEILRDEWGFTGTVVSDYFAVDMLHAYHKIVGSKVEAAALALDAGIDVELPSTDCYGAPLLDAVQRGLIRQDVLDTAVRRVLAQKFALGLFENPYVEVEAVQFDTPADRALARQIAAQSLVLLRNEGDLLPLAKDVDSIAVIGPNADSTRNLFGDYSYPAHLEALTEMKANSTFDTPTPDAVTVEQDFIAAVSILDGIKAKVGAGTTVRYAQGCDVLSDSRAGFAEAVEAARASKLAILVMGDKAGLTDGCTSGEACDRAELGLPGVQADLARAVYETGTPIVLVLVNGRPVALDWMAEAIPAILVAWFPGEEGGNAVADALFGDVNPGGKLPISFPHTAGQVPVYYGHKPSGGRSQWKGNYVETPSSPLYPFGYGLSYTHFAYSNLRLSAEQARVGDVVKILADVQNVGMRAGDEVVQLYTHTARSSVTRPVKELRGFTRVRLAPGEKRTVTFQLAVNQLGYYDRAMRFGVEPGLIEVFVGRSSQEDDLCGHFDLIRAGEIAEKAFFSGVEVG